MSISSGTTSEKKTREKRYSIEFCPKKSAFNLNKGMSEMACHEGIVERLA